MKTLTMFWETLPQYSIWASRKVEDVLNRAAEINISPTVLPLHFLSQYLISPTLDSSYTLYSNFMDLCK